VRALPNELAKSHVKGQRMTVISVVSGSSVQVLATETGQRQSTPVWLPLFCSWLTFVVVHTG